MLNIKCCLAYMLHSTHYLFILVIDLLHLGLRLLLKEQASNMLFST